MQVGTPYYPVVPKGMSENLLFRQSLLVDAAGDVGLQGSLRGMCAADPLFYINAFCWTHDPRLEALSTVPFITWGEYQDEAILSILGAIGKEDLLIEKSRDMGATWLLLVCFDWAWRFRPGQSFLVVSRNEDYVDKPGNPKSLFWKLDFLHDVKRLPTWMLPAGWSEKCRTRMHIENPENGSVIDGESTTGDVARGDRRTAIMLDEFSAFEVGDGYRALSSTRDVTRSRLFNGTPQGANNAFYEMTKKVPVKLRLHWSQHPEKKRGLYTSDGDDENGYVLRVLDTSYVFPVGYKFVLDGKLRSPWYDVERTRCASDQEAGQELDIDYLGSGHQFFPAQLIERLVAETCQPAFIEGELEYDPDTAVPRGFTRKEGGRWKCWMNVDLEGKAPGDRQYAIGADVAVGTGATPSCISAVDRKTGEKVLEFAEAHIDPARFAYALVATAKWLNDAYLTWEANGPGRITGNRVIEIGYRNIYWRKNEQTLSKKQTDAPGWHSTGDNKNAVLGEYRRALSMMEVVNHSKRALQECLFYVFGSDGTVEHSRALSNVDPTQGRKNHGDLVIADALAWKGARERPELPPKAGADMNDLSAAPAGSYGARMRERQAAVARHGEW